MPSRSPRSLRSGTIYCSRNSAPAPVSPSISLVTSAPPVPAAAPARGMPAPSSGGDPPPQQAPSGGQGGSGGSGRRRQRGKGNGGQGGQAAPWPSIYNPWTGQITMWPGQGADVQQHNDPSLRSSSARAGRIFPRLPSSPLRHTCLRCSHRLHLLPCHSRPSSRPPSQHLRWSGRPRLRAGISRRWPRISAPCPCRSLLVLIG